MKRGTVGKFEGCECERLAEILYEICGTSGYDRTAGDVQENGTWAALIEHRDHAYIVTEDSRGFFEYSRHSINHAHELMDQFEDEIAEAEEQEN